MTRDDRTHRRLRCLIPISFVLVLVVMLSWRQLGRRYQRPGADLACPLCEPAAHQALHHAYGLVQQVPTPHQQVLMTWKLANLLDAVGYQHAARHLRAIQTRGTG